MKRAAAKNTVEILRKVESIEKEIKDLKLSLLKSMTPSTKKPITLKGILKGVEETGIETRAKLTYRLYVLHEVSLYLPKESSEKLLYALLITQISKEDYTDFSIFSVYSASA